MSEYATLHYLLVKNKILKYKVYSFPFIYIQKFLIIFNLFVGATQLPYFTCAYVRVFTMTIKF